MNAKTNKLLVTMVRVFFMTWLTGLTLMATASQLPPTTTTGEPSTQFNQRQYLLGYNVYLEDGNLAAAYRVATKAVREAPSDLEWKRRLAQVALWLGELPVALDNWLVVAKKRNRNADWQQVKKIAQALNDNKSLLLWHLREVRLHPDSTRAIKALTTVYEKLGRPDKALDFLAAFKKRHPNKAVYEEEERLQTLIGADDKALANLHWLNSHIGPREDWLLRAASINYRHGKLLLAQQLLEQYQQQMPTSAVAYWRTYAELSRLLGKSKKARNGYARVYASGKAQKNDLLNYAALLNSNQPLKAASISAQAFHQFGVVKSACNALYLWISQSKLGPAKRFLANLSPSEHNKLEKDAEFHQLRGLLAERQGNWRAAMADYQSGLLLAKTAEEHINLLQASISLLTQHIAGKKLHKLLIDNNQLASQQPVLWGVWASGWMRLGRPSLALPWLQKQVQLEPTNALLLFAYTDALLQAGFSHKAQKLQKALWVDRANYLAKTSPQNQQQLRHALINATLKRLPADAKQRSLTQLINDNEDSQGRIAPWVRDLVLNAAWQLNQGAADTLPLYVSQRLEVAPDAPLPAWSQMAIALSHQDRPQIDKLLTERFAELPYTSRIDAAEQLSRYDQATSLAFAGAEAHPHDDEIQQRLQQRTWNDASWVQLSWQQSKQGGLTFSPKRLTWKGHIDGNQALHFSTQQTHIEQRSGPLRLPFSNQTSTAIGYSRKAEGYHWALWLTHMHSLDSTFGVKAKGTKTLESHVSVSGRFGWHQASNLSSGLRVAGMQNYLGANLSWAISQRDTVYFDSQYNQLRVQNGDNLGHFLINTLGYNQRLFSDDRDWLLKANITHASASSTPDLPSSLKSLAAKSTTSAADFTPSGYQQYGLAIAYGENSQQHYQRAWHYFWEFGLTQDEKTGIGHHYQFGILGRLVGNDCLRLYIKGADGVQKNQEKTQTLNIDYRLLY